MRVCSLPSQGQGGGLCRDVDTHQTRLDQYKVQVQVQFQIFIHDNAKKCTVEVHLEKKLKLWRLLKIGRSALKVR